MFYTGRFCPEVQPLTLLIELFLTEKEPLSNTYLAYNFVSLLTAVNVLSLKYE